MIEALAFVVAIPLSVELFGALYAVFDASRQADSRAAAVERLAAPLLAWGALWWLAGSDAWRVLIAALVFVLICHVVVFYTGRWLIKRPGVQTIAVDTESDDVRPGDT
jgi:hypothetical protein